jgi:CDP-6-deoxy-D-xylo-4-hexulose-3-dehydrase
VKQRRANFDYLVKSFIENGLDSTFILPRATKNATPSWFGFPLTIKDRNIKRHELLDHLEKGGISTRLLFAGNITCQPYFIDYNVKYKIIGSLHNTDKVMNDSFWIGLYPGLNTEHLDYQIQTIKQFLAKR